MDESVKNLSNNQPGSIETFAAVSSFFRTHKSVSRSSALSDKGVKVVFGSQIVDGDPTASLLGVSNHVMNKEIELFVPKDRSLPVVATVRLNAATEDDRLQVIESRVEIGAADGALYDKAVACAEILEDLKANRYVERKALANSQMTLTQQQKIGFATIENGPAGKHLDFQSKTGKQGFYAFSESGTNAIALRHLEDMLKVSDSKFSEDSVAQAQGAIQSELEQYSVKVTSVVERFHQMLKDEAREQEEVSKLRKNQGPRHSLG